MSHIAEKIYSDHIEVMGIPTLDYGRVVGRNGRNATRIEREYNIKLRFIPNQNLHITGGNPEKRRAAARDVTENLPVVVQCPKLPLGNKTRISSRMIKHLSFKYEVRIERPSASKKHGTILGKTNRCGTVYDILKKQSTYTFDFEV